MTETQNPPAFGGLVDDIERCYAAGWHDGLPVVPPYRSLVDRMLEALGWTGDTVVGEIESQRLTITATEVAAAAVMSGCLPEYGRVLRALTEAMFEPAFNLSGTEVTTGGVSVTVLVSGPVVTELGFNTNANSVGGSNVRVNATVGRFANMVRHLCGHGGGVLEQHGTLGHPGRVSGLLIAERPSRLWEPFHVQTGLPAEVSAVSIISSEGPNSVNNHYGSTAEAVLDTIADCMGHAGQTNYYWHSGVIVAVLGPAHTELIAASYSKDEVRQYLYEKARRSTDELIRLGRVPAEPRPQFNVVPGTMRSPLPSADRLYIIEGGCDGGQFSAVIPSWVGSTEVITKQVKEV